MVCPHCGKMIIKQGKKPKFCIKKGHVITHSFRDTNIWASIDAKIYHNEIKWYDNQYSESLKDIYNIIKNNKDDIICVFMLINNKYISGEFHIFPDGTYAFNPNINVVNIGWRDKCIITYNKYWMFRLFYLKSGIEIVSDPKLCLGLFNNLYKILDFTSREPPIYNDYVKVNPDVYWEKSQNWDSIINNVWIKKINKFIKELNENELNEFKIWYNDEIKKLVW